MSLYATLLLCSILVPAAFSFNRRIGYLRRFPALAAGIGITAILLIAADALFAYLGVWGFNSRYVGSVRWLYLPLEEWLFFLVIPYASVFIYASIKNLLPNLQFGKWVHYLSLSVAILCLTIALMNQQRLYTFWVCLIAAVILFFHARLRKEWMGYFWLAYFIHLIPFLAVNGLLTGMATDEPVVWYSPEAHLGIRLITIPVEDTVYALILLLMPVTLMEMWSATGSVKKESILFI